VACQLDALKSCLNVASLRRALNALPKTLDDIYDRILTNIDEEQLENAFVALQWLTFSARPLHIHEIAEAIAVGIGRNCATIEEHRLFDARDVLAVCSSLIAVSEVTSQVRLAHHSVREYLMSDRLRIKPVVQIFSISESLAKKTIAEACLHYLLVCDKNDSLSADSANGYPLLFYAAKTWFVHAVAASTEEHTDLVDLISNLLDASDCGAFVNWLKIAEPDKPWKIPSLAPGGLPDIGSHLYYASFCGLSGVVKRLLAQGAQVQDTGFFGTPMHAASVSGHASVIELLKLHGADLNAKFNGLTPLHRAVQAGHEDVARMLIKLGAELMAQDGSGATPMHQAAAHGHSTIVRLLLNAGASPNTLNQNRQSVMRIAVAAGQLEVMQLLISSRVDVNEKRDGNTLLHLAASNHDNAAVLKLIEMGIDLEAKNTSGFTALHLACRSGGRSPAATVKLLVEHGADIEARSNEQDTPLHLASHNQSLATAEVLLTHHANFRAINKWNHTPLYLAKFGEWYSVGVAEESQAPMISLLERYCATLAEPNETPRQQITSRSSIPLHWAAKSNKILLVRQHLDAKEPVDEKATDGSTALHYAVEGSRSLEITALLLERGADPNARRVTDGYAPLHVRVSTSYLRDAAAYAILDKLISYKADVRARAANNQSVVGLAACQNLATPIQRLLEEGADVNSPFLNTRSALNVAAWHAHIETMKVLIDAKANVNNDESGQVPFLEIVCSRGASKDLNRYVEGAKMLLDAGADINYKYCGSATALGRAVFNGNLGLVKLLMDRRADPIGQRLSDGQSLVECALERGHKDIAKYLEDAGVKRDGEN
jgi:ankyrin repeat protein